MLNKDTVIGFIGTGVMGKSMVQHLLRQGYRVLVYNRTKAKTGDLLEAGAVWEDTPAAVASKATVTITMVGFPADVEEIYLNEEGIINNCQPGSYLIDMTTSSPALAVKIYEKAKAKGVFALDAPVSGGDVGARNATLTIMVGGDEEAFHDVEPILRILGNNVILQGGAGAGHHTKMCNQIAIASNMMGVCEAIAYAKKAGLDPSRVLQSIGTGAAGSWSLNNLAPRMMAEDFAPGFYVKHFIKDMKIALDAAKEMGIPMPGLELAKKLYDELASSGGNDSGTQALYKLYCQE
ncbi:MAG: NAD(P)-dependent oxidoreductase [Dethiobacter sp.]|jgi:3-hydroxyisobutyrate dehydrogenase|nr:NAD(P)-dependent oxidoreductase [Dethiobacter sp.]